jgi:outer membrane protein OmpA-like peptidoglycan-associated protein
VRVFVLNAHESGVGTSMGRIRAKGRFSTSVRQHVLAAFFVLQGSVVVEAAVNAQEITRHQAYRDSLFKNLKATTTQYTFDYLVIYLPAGTLPGVNVPVPVSHIRFKTTVFFAFSQYSLEPSAEAAIADLAKTILIDKSARSVLVAGHTDAIGTDQYNATLSLNRAVAVASKLREAGVNDKLMGVVPMGEAQPMATNRTVEGRTQNRRVEFFISDFPEATRRAIELVNFNPCHRNDQDVGVGKTNPECNNIDIRIPLYSGSSGQGRPEMLDLGRQALTTSSVPTNRIPLPNETLVRPSLKDLESN